MRQFSERYSEDIIMLRCDGAAWRKSWGLELPENIVLFHNNWSYEDVSKENLAECIKISEQWYENHVDTIDLERERYSLSRICELFDEFDVRGGILRVDGKAIAFNLGTPVNKDVIIGMFAKANKNYLYSSIFMIQEFIKRGCSEFRYFNFTEDGGVLGLRKFKNELRPAGMSPFYYVTINVGK